uniref:Acidic leucine-rich nuclear phosphoprotein 32 family member n=1 Tax=Gadus morhua TaxID=8049 RepID=A0A8C5A5K3_GADMO
MDMKKRISMELGDRDPSEVLELDVHSCRSADGEVEGLTDEYKELEFLSMVSVGLSSLAKLPPLPKLHKLEVNNNAISGGLDVLVAKCPSLSYLNLCGNKIKDFAALEALRNLKSLQRLELIGCEVTTLDDYRASVFDLLPQIVYLDGYDPEDNEAPDSEEEDGERGGTRPRGAGVLLDQAAWGWGPTGVLLDQTAWGRGPTGVLLDQTGVLLGSYWTRPLGAGVLLGSYWTRPGSYWTAQPYVDIESVDTLSSKATHNRTFVRRKRNNSISVGIVRVFIEPSANH